MSELRHYVRRLFRGFRRHAGYGRTRVLYYAQFRRCQNRDPWHVDMTLSGQRIDVVEGRINAALWAACTRRRRWFVSGLPGDRSLAER